MISYAVNLLAFNLIIIVVIVIAFAFSVKYRGIKVMEYFKSKEGKGAIKSAATAVIALIILSAIISIFASVANSSPFKGGTFFNDAGVYAGLDYPNQSSPQCKAGSSDDRFTSNLGAWLNGWQSKDKNIRINGRYTHHSCFLGSDKNTYDAFGVQVEWKIFSRR